MRENKACFWVFQGIGVKEIFEAVVHHIPPPPANKREGRQCVVLQDSWYDPFRGTVNLVQVVDGSLKCGDDVTSAKTGLTYSIKTLGILTPQERPVDLLSPGQIGVMTCNMKTPRDAIIGDTFYSKVRGRPGMTSSVVGRGGLPIYDG